MILDHDEVVTRKRRQFLKASVAGAAGIALLPQLVSAQTATSPQSAEIPAFELDEATLESLRHGLESGKYTSRSLVEKYLGRIGVIDKHGPMLGSIIEINPDALTIATEMDQERQAKGARGPLHGIPVLIKDNIATADKMQTTAGSLALVGAKSGKDSYVATRLREAGAVILGKTNCSEWANFRSTHSSSGWSGRGGQTRLPYALDRNPSGSSSGSAVAVAANLCAVAVGTETDGSIVSPSSSNGIVGLKPTVGLVSRSGIVPISHTQDTAGPMTRTVADAAALLGVLAGEDATDPATANAKGHFQKDYTSFLDVNGLRGAKIGVVRKYAGYNDHVDRVFEIAIDVMKKAGAEVVDPVDVPTIGKFDDAELQVLLYEFKADLNSYLASLAASQVRTLKEIIAFNEKNKETELRYFGQELMLQAEGKRPLSSADYKKQLAKCRRMSRKEGIDAVMDKHHLDALIAPTGNPAWPTDLVNGDHFTGSSTSLAAVAGYPNINVPMGEIYGLPVGLSFFGRAWSEPTLIKLAYSYEQASKLRTPPKFLSTIQTV